MKEYGIKELQRILSSKVLVEPFNVKCDNQLLGTFIPAGLQGREDNLLNGIINNLIELQEKVEAIQRPQIAYLPANELEEVVTVKCEYPGCGRQTSNNRQEVTFRDEKAKVVWCDTHINAYLGGVE